MSGPLWRRSAAHRARTEAGLHVSRMRADVHQPRLPLRRQAMSAAMGPFETEREISALPEVQAIYEAFHADPGAGKMAPRTRLMPGRVLDAAGVAMGAYDDRIADWLATWEPQTVAVIAGWVSRARAAECGLLRAEALSESGAHHATLAKLAQAQDEVGRLRAELAGAQAASPSGRGEPAAALTGEQLSTVLHALYTAADHERDVAATCGECEVRPEGLCRDTRLDRPNRKGAERAAVEAAATGAEAADA